jgi:RNA polymerase sigma factor (TIGR02999 family)
MSDLTRILERMNRNEPGAVEELVPLVYEELRRRAHACLSDRRNGNTLQPTALVHEAFLKLTGAPDGGASWQGSRHFYNAAAEVMRQIVVSYGRRRRAKKRGGGARRVDLSGVEPIAERAIEPDWDALDQALAELRGLDERRYRVVMLRYFSGLTDAQVARTLEVSEKTVERDWATAKTFLRGRMAELSGTEE